MIALNWIIISGLLMTLIALICSITLLLKASTVERLLSPMVTFAAGSLLGSVFFHLFPMVNKINSSTGSWALLIAAGFIILFIFKPFSLWHYNAKSPENAEKPMTYIMMVGGGLQSFVVGMTISWIFLIDIRLGIICWFAAVAHAVPKKLQDLVTLVHTGWSRRSILVFNILSSQTYLLGGLTAYIVFYQIDTFWLISFAAGNFIYITISDLVSKTNQFSNLKRKDCAIMIILFTAGLSLFYFAMP